MEMKKKGLCFLRMGVLLIAIICILLPALEVEASMPYETYSYNWWGEDVAQPHTYLFGEALEPNGTKLMNPQDLFIRDNTIYIADTDNSRVIVMDEMGDIKLEISGFTSQTGTDSFSKPQGIYITEDHHIYVADSGNGRVVELDQNGTYIREIGRPATQMLPESQNYVPTKVVVDYAGRIYVTAYGVNLGLVEFNKEGEFQGFMGATQVSVSPFQYFWKNYFSTDAQKKRMQTIIPTEYNNLYVDSKNFVYATISNLKEEDFLNGADAIRRLNPTGTDVLRRLGNNDIIGDLYKNIDSNSVSWSTFADVYATDYGFYFILDSSGGKVFGYDYDGNSIFIFGSKGTRAGLVQKPVAIDSNSDQSQIYILDSQLNAILKFQITEYGQALLGAMKAHFEGKSEKAAVLWQEVLDRNANSEVAYIGIGKSFLKEGEYKKAMEYFQLGNSRKYYTRAFKFYRKELMQGSFGKIAGVLGVLILFLVIIGFIKKIKKWVDGIMKGACD